MAIDNLNFYSAWLPAGQQTDRYSSQPWCLRSKNLDIFSSSKSVKATAWSNPTTTDADVIKEEWGLVLKTDWKVYERTNNWDVLVVDPSVNFPVYPVCYTWKNGTYVDAQWGTPTAMSVATEWDEWKSFVVFTDKASYVYSKVKYTPKKTWRNIDYITKVSDTATVNGYEFTKSSNESFCTISLYVDPTWFTSWKLKLYAIEDAQDDTNISIDSIKAIWEPTWYYYDAAADDITYNPTSQQTAIPYSWSITDGIIVDIPAYPNWWQSQSYYILMKFNFTKKEWASSYGWSHWKLYIDFNGWPDEDHVMKINWVSTEWDFNDYYNYLPIRNRELTEIWVYWYSMTYWMKWTTYQYVYKWISSFVDVWWATKTRYDFVTDMGWANDPWMDVIWLIIWNEQVHMIWNLNWNGYIIPCDLSWGIGTPYIWYWCEFKWVTNIDYLMYLVWEDRGISQLWVYNWQELVAILWGTEEKTSKNLIDNTEQYKFDWNMVEYRDDLILSTTDNRIFAYWQTFWGKGWTFIHELPWTIKELKADWKDLSVKYTVNSTDYVTTLQDDTPIKKYNTEWIAEYPIVIWNHLLEKEESDLYASYILPSANCSLEFWGMANHYHFWTFTSADNYTFSTTADYKMKGCTWNYALKFIEKNGNQYTFRLEWDLPIQTTNDMKITDTEWTELITYSDFNHFRKIGEITTTEYQEWEFRFHNLNNKLELPKSHSLQIMVKWKWTANYTPELFALDLVANQRDRW